MYQRATFVWELQTSHCPWLTRCHINLQSRAALSGLLLCLRLHILLSAQASSVSPPPRQEACIFSFTKTYFSQIYRCQSSSQQLPRRELSHSGFHIHLVEKANLGTCDCRLAPFPSLSNHCREAPRCSAHQGSSQPEKQEAFWET